MNITEWLSRLMVGFGAGWVMVLLIALSVIAIAHRLRAVVRRRR